MGIRESGIFFFPMDRTSKLYRLSAELTMLRNDIQKFETFRPSPNEWTKKEAAHYDSLIKRRNHIRAEIAELGALRPHPRRH
jgi:hypothetical protein